MLYYPDQRHLLEMTTIRRERFLQEDAVGRAEVREGASVNFKDIVARGRLPSRYTILEAAQFFRLKNPADLADYMLVETGKAVEVKTPLAKVRNKQLLSPIAGFVAYIGDGRIILQVAPEEVDLEAGLDGQVVSVERGRGVVIESFGGLVQGVWGNGRRTIATLRMEPEDGLENIFSDALDIQYRGAVVVTKRPLREVSLQVIVDQGLLGVVAPSMEADLIAQAQELRAAILLTEGFGPLKMSAAVSNLLTTMAGRQILLDAVQPTRWEARRPELVISPTGRSSSRPPRLNPDTTLQAGVTVRLTRPPFAGATGRILNLPKTPQLLDNGLRVLCAQVELVTGEKVTVPLANIEVFGR